MIHSQKDLKKAIFREKENMKEKDIFLSENYNVFLTQMQQGVTECGFKGSATMFNDPKGPIAFTNGICTYINYNSDLTAGLKKVEKHYLFCGLNLHECGHQLFTDFALINTTIDKLQNGEIYPAPADNAHMPELRNFLAAGNGPALMDAFQKLNNCIEDGFVDRAVMKVVPGYASCLRFVNSIDKVIGDCTYAEMQSKHLPEESIFINLVLSYARHGIKAYEESDRSNELVAYVEEILPCINKAVMEASPFQRMKEVWTVFSYLFHFIKIQNDKNQNGSQTANSQNKKNVSSSQGQSGSAGNNESTQQEDSLSKHLQGLGSQMSNSEKIEHQNTQAPNQSAIQAMNNMASDEDPGKPLSGQENAPSSSKELEHLTEQIAERITAQKQEAEILANMKDDTQALGGVSIHKNISARISRIPVSKEGIQAYEALHGELDTIVRRFLKDFEKEIKDRQTGDTLTGLYSGKRITMREAYRYDKKVFNRKILPEDIPDMAIGILLDMSGSMSGDRLAAAIMCAYITYEFCRRLHIPCFVMGHSTHDFDVTLFSAVDESSLDNMDKYRIFSMEAKDSNRDGYALRYCLNKLGKIPAVDKILMVISDGRPNHYGYGLTEGQTDCQNAVSEALKKGITTIAAGIGDSEQVKKVYKEGISDKNSAIYLDLSDLGKLPKAFIKIIREKLS